MLWVTATSSDGRASTRRVPGASIDRSITRPGKCWAVETKRDGINYAVVAWYFARREDADRRADEVNTGSVFWKNTGRRNYDARVVPAKAFTSSDDAPSQLAKAATIDDLIAAIRSFADARDWSQFHTPRNLVLALAGEVGELAAEFQWISDQEVAEALTQAQKKLSVESELADVAIYALRLANVLDIDLSEAISRKLLLNEQRYPVKQARGNARKYTELGES